MADLNKVFLMGRLTFDPELRHTPGGAAVTDLRLATSRSWTGKDGTPQKDTLYIDVTVWNRQAENCCQYLKKGRAVHVEGFLKMESWDDKNTGEKRSKVKVEADRVQFLDSRSDSAGGGGGGFEDDFASPAPAPAPSRESAPRRAPMAGGQAPPRGGFAPMNGGSTARRPPADAEGDDDDIPF